jgi:murein DD-endopeptidase MepM/ murein hydrolase activator NlpD
MPKLARSAAIAVLCAMLGSVSGQNAAPLSDEEGIVPSAYHVVPIVLESSLSPDEAVVRYSRDGKGREERNLRSTFPFIHPLEDDKAAIAAGFGVYPDSPTGKHEFHPGIDFIAEKGTPVRAAGSGKVVRSGYTAGYGIHIAIDHGSFMTIYGHLAPKPKVMRGDRVEAGQVIGMVGDTGRCERPLLHYEIQLSKYPFGTLYAVDPGIFLALIAKAGVKGKASTLCFGYLGLQPTIKAEGNDVFLRFDLNGADTAVKAPKDDVPLLHPLGKPKAIIDTGFGVRNNPFNGRKEFHAGIDIVTPYGSPVRSPANGVVAKVGYEDGYGSFIIIRHGDLVTLFSHLDGKPGVREGEAVSAGRLIGRTGKTGRSTGPHLHYEIRYVPDRASNFKEEVKWLFNPEDILGMKAK